MKSIFSNYVSTGKGEPLKMYFVFCFCSSISLNNVFDDMICLVNTDSIFTLDYVNFDKIYLLVLLGSYSQIECQIAVLIFQIKSYSVLKLVCHIIHQQGIICSSCRPMRIQHGQRSF